MRRERIIYKITNLINNKIYIGQFWHSPDNLKRCSEWKLYFGGGKLIKRAIKKYGIENFRKDILEIIENGTRLQADTAETKWIAQLNSTNKTIGYNIAPGGWGGYTTENYTDEEKKLYKKKLSDVKQNWSLEKKKWWSKTVSKNTKQMWNNRTEEERKIIGQKISVSIKNNPNILRGKKNPNYQPRQGYKGINNPNSKLTEQNVRDIRNEYNNSIIKRGMIRKLAKKYNINGSTMNDVIKNKSYKNVI